MHLSRSVSVAEYPASMNYQAKSKPMAISTITSPANYHALAPSPTSSSPRSVTMQSPTSPSFFSPHPSTISSLPSSPEYHNHILNHPAHHTPPRPRRLHVTHPHDDGHLPYQSSSFLDPNMPLSPLSLHERRQRNKAASAKYRAKKNQQHGEMRSVITSLTKENDLLLRQLDHVRLENTRLKATCDRLRGKMLAEKMLKRLLRGNATINSSSDEPCDISAENPCGDMQTEARVDIIESDYEYGAEDDSENDDDDDYKDEEHIETYASLNMNRDPIPPRHSR